MPASETIRFRCRHIHLPDGSLAEGEVACAQGQPLELRLGAKTADSLRLPDAAHIAPGRFDPHVHFRECPVPQPEEVEALGPAGASCEALAEAARQANAAYSIRSGSLAALRGGVCAVGAMGNTPWGPAGPARHRLNQAHYDARSLTPVAVWPRMEPGVAAVPGHEGKDFGSTFGGFGLDAAARRAMYEAWRGEAVSYHNDQPRPDESIEAFRDRVRPDPRLLHHLYFGGETVLACQLETMEIAGAAGVSSLLARHVPTGPALQQILDAAAGAACALPAEIGLDYMYWNRDRLIEQDPERALINCRRPAHPSKEDQAALIALARSAAKAGYPVFFGSDHAPHTLEAKAFRRGLPGSPGTRLIEHTLQYHLELVRRWGYDWSDIDRLAAVNPARHMARYMTFPYEVGPIAEGAMANLAIFDPGPPYAVDERLLAEQLEDPHYHSCLAGESGLRGKSLYTVVNGRVWDVQGSICPLN